MNEKMEAYLNYFGCLLGGIFIAESLSPKMRNATLFEKFLLLGLTTYGGSLMGSYFYKLTFQETGRCPCGCCCNEDSEDEEE